MFKGMTIEELQARKKQIAVDCEAENADLDALETEARGINAELEARAEAAEKRAAIRASVAAGKAEDTTVIESRKDEKVDKTKEVRNSKEYIEAFARFIKTEDATECRSLLTTNVEDGQVPVPDFVIKEIETAWEQDGIMARVRRTAMKGNISIGFELSATGAVIHTEGTPAPDEEELKFGATQIIPQMVKKWVSISDEALEMGGEEFLRYIYAELAYQISLKCAEIVVDKIKALPAVPTATSVSAKVVKMNPGMITISKASGKLASAARPVILMNRETESDFEAAAFAANYPADIFKNYDVLYTDRLPSFEEASEDDTYAILVDLKAVLANIPAAFRVKTNDTSRAKEDLVEYIGEEYIGVGVTKDRHAVLIKKAAQANG